MEESTVTEADLDHVALSCKGTPLALATFYATTLGFAPVDFDRYTAGEVPFPSVRLNARTILDFFATTNTADETGLAPGSHLCFALPRPSLTRLCTRLQLAGIEYSDPVTRSGARGTGKSIYFRDPEGNNLECRHYEP